MGYELILDPKKIRSLYRRLLMAGYSKEEAGNLIAKLMGLAPAKKGWTTKELEHMLFLQELDKHLSH